MISALRGWKGALAAGDAQNGLQGALGARRCTARGLLVSGNACTAAQLPAVWQCLGH